MTIKTVPRDIALPIVTTVFLKKNSKKLSWYGAKL